MGFFELVNNGTLFLDEIAIKPKNEKAIKSLEKLCEQEENIEIKFLSDMYPVGDERVIVRSEVEIWTIAIRGRGCYIKCGNIKKCDISYRGEKTCYN